MTRNPAKVANAADKRRATRSVTVPQTVLFVPEHLGELIQDCEYKPGWEAYLDPFTEGDVIRGMALYIESHTEDSIRPGKMTRVRHEFVVPPTSWNRDTWAAWLFDRFRDVETHEAAEFFKIDGVREFAPHHGNGEDPYRVWHMSDHATAKKRAGED